MNPLTASLLVICVVIGGVVLWRVLADAQLRRIVGAATMVVVAILIISVITTSDVQCRSDQAKQEDQESAAGSHDPGPGTEAEPEAVEETDAVASNGSKPVASSTDASLEQYDKPASDTVKQPPEKAEAPPYSTGRVKQWFKDHRLEGWKRIPVANLRHETAGMPGYELLTNLALMDGGTYDWAYPVDPGPLLDLFDGEGNELEPTYATPSRIRPGMAAVWVGQRKLRPAFYSSRPQQAGDIPMALTFDARPPVRGSRGLGFGDRSQDGIDPSSFVWQRLQRSFSPVSGQRENYSCTVLPYRIDGRGVYFDLHVEFLPPEDLYGDQILRLSLSPAVLEEHTPAVGILEKPSPNHRRKIVFIRNCFNPVFRTSSEELADDLAAGRQKAGMVDAPHQGLLAISCAAPMRVHVILRVRAETIQHNGPDRH